MPLMKNVSTGVNDKSFVYFDPPYRPLSKTSSFISYSKGDFNDDSQTELASLTKELHKKNVSILAFQFRS